MSSSHQAPIHKFCSELQWDNFADADGDSLTLSYEWSNGSNILGYTDTLIMSNTLAASDSITCTITVSDPYGATVSDSESVIVENIAPTVDSVTISPSTAVHGDTLTCLGMPQMTMGVRQHCLICGRSTAILFHDRHPHALQCGRRRRSGLYRHSGGRRWRNRHRLRQLDRGQHRTDDRQHQSQSEQHQQPDFQHSLVGHRQ